jgi:hypothetical protein
MPCQDPKRKVGEFRMVLDPERAVSLFTLDRGMWGRFHSLNRTFYEVSPQLCSYLTRKGMIYTDDESNIITLGARFQPEQTLHIGLYHGDPEKCFNFAMHLCKLRGAARLSCDFPADNLVVQEELFGYGFTIDRSEIIVMEINN